MNVICFERKEIKLKVILMEILRQSTNNSDIIELIAESFTEILFWQMKKSKGFCLL